MWLKGGRELTLVTAKSYIKSIPNILFTIERIVEAIEGIWKALLGFQPYFYFDVSFEGDLARKK